MTTVFGKVIGDDAASVMLLACHTSSSLGTAVGRFHATTHVNVNKAKLLSNFFTVVQSILYAVFYLNIAGMHAPCIA